MRCCASDEIPQPRKGSDTMVGGDAVPAEGEGPFELEPGTLVEGEPDLVSEDEVDDSVPI